MRSLTEFLTRSTYGKALAVLNVDTIKKHRFFIVIVLVASGVFVLNGNHVIEQGIFQGHIIPYAEHIAGDGTRDLLSYPLWGYPFLLFLLGIFGLMALQFFFAVLAFMMIYNRFFASLCTDAPRRVLVIILSLPWFAYMSVKWPSAIAMALAWIAICEYARGIEEGFRLRHLLIAGVLLGIALNFRSEILVIVFILLVVVPAWHIPLIIRGRRRVASSMFSLVAFGAAAIILLIPWAAFNYSRDSDFRFTSSNGGAVGAISLGQLPGNPWGIIHNDSEASRIVRELGQPSVEPFSIEGDRLLRQYFFGAISDFPEAYAFKIIHNARNIFLGGFYIGDWEQLLSDSDTLYIEVLKEKIKSELGVNPNLTEIEGYKAEGLWPPRLQLTAGLIAFGMSMLYLIASDLLILIATLGGLWRITRRHVENNTKILIVVMLSVMAVAALLQYQPRHINFAWPAMVGIFLSILPRRFDLNRLMTWGRPVE